MLKAAVGGDNVPTPGGPPASVVMHCTVGARGAAATFLAQLLP